MNHIRAIIAAAGLAFALGGCVSTPSEPKDYTRYYAEKPASILVVPVINHTQEVDASALFLTTMAVPLAERGYYVFPTNAASSLMSNEGLGDPGLVHKASTVELARVFDADAVLYVEVLDWKSSYQVIDSKLETEFLYTLKSGNTGEVLWQDQQEFDQSLSASTGNIFADLLANALTSMVNNTRSDFTPQALNANIAVLTLDGQGLPFGPRSANSSKNATLFPASGTGKISDAQREAMAAPGLKAPATPIDADD